MTNRFNLYQTTKLALIAGLMTLAPSLVSAQEPRCSVLKGTYTFAFSATGSTTAGPFNGVGLTTFDGAGKWTGIESVNFKGSIVRSQPFSGTYTLNPNCTGTIIAVFANGVVGAGQDFVVANGGKTINAIGLGDRGLLSTTFTRMR
jgi:hypothetical protein